MHVVNLIKTASARGVAADKVDDVIRTKTRDLMASVCLGGVLVIAQVFILCYYTFQIDQVEVDQEFATFERTLQLEEEWTRNFVSDIAIVPDSEQCGAGYRELWTREWLGFDEGCKTDAGVTAVRDKEAEIGGWCEYIKPVPAVVQNGQPGVRICGLVSDLNMMSATFADSNGCPGSTKKCSEATATENTVCIDSGADATTCPITSFIISTDDNRSGWDRSDDRIIGTNESGTPKYYLYWSRTSGDNRPVGQTRVEFEPCINPEEVSSNVGISEEKSADYIIDTLFKNTDHKRPYLLPNKYPTENDLLVGGCIRDKTNSMKNDGNYKKMSDNWQVTELEVQTNSGVAAIIDGQEGAGDIVDTAAKAEVLYNFWWRPSIAMNSDAACQAISIQGLIDAMTAKKEHVSVAGDYNAYLMIWGTLYFGGILLIALCACTRSYPARSIRGIKYTTIVCFVILFGQQLYVHMHLFVALSAFTSLSDASETLKGLGGCVDAAYDPTGSLEYARLEQLKSDTMIAYIFSWVALVSIILWTLLKVWFIINLYSFKHADKPAAKPAPKKVEMKKAAEFGLGKAPGSEGASIDTNAATAPAGNKVGIVENPVPSLPATGSNDQSKTGLLNEEGDKEKV